MLPHLRSATYPETEKIEPVLDCKQGASSSGRLYIELSTYHTAPRRLPDASSVSAVKPISLLALGLEALAEGNAQAP